MIRVLIVDDHALFRESLAFMPQREPDITVSGQAGTLAEARDLLVGTDVVLLDLDLPDGNGRELIRGLHALNPHGSALVLTASTARPEVAGAAVVQHAPQLVLCSRLSEVVETRALAWVLLYPHRTARDVISVAGRRHTVPDPGIDGLLRVVDQAELLARDDAR